MRHLAGMPWRISLTACLTLSFILHLSSLTGQTQKGIASYYSKKATGRMTSNGERLHHDSLTCAHRTFPFGTLLKVTNPANSRVVVVRVTDRGPFGRGRIIDLSWGAAKELDILTQGIASVIVEPLSNTIIPMKDTSRIKLPEIELAVPIMSSVVLPVWRDSLQFNHKRTKGL
jgi:rare lipoprotein A